MPAINIERKVSNEGLEFRLNGQLLPTKFGPGGNLEYCSKRGDQDSTSNGQRERSRRKRSESRNLPDSVAKKLEKEIAKPWSIEVLPRRLNFSKEERKEALLSSSIYELGLAITQNCD